MAATAMIEYEGLSPRVRGNRLEADDVRVSQGSIPACAGEPVYGSGVGSREGVYPRVCGGTLVSDPMMPRADGLSPRVRGNRHHGAGIPARSWSIPACAGEPTTPSCRHQTKTVYPRVCGGTAGPCALTLRAGGLSPRVRGNRGRRSLAYLGGWSIPACAGEPFQTTRSRPRHTVYPRVCGGTFGLFVGMASTYGLSPRVRGNHNARRRGRGAHGSIPACAGEPAIARRGIGQRDAMVYPRVCGGTAASSASTARRWGLSPRVRGNPLPPRPPNPKTRCARSIPACAGEPR